MPATKKAAQGQKAPTRPKPDKPAAPASPPPPPKKEKEGNPTAATQHQEEIVRLVYAPKLLDIITSKPDITKAELVRVYNENHGTTVSETSVNEWLKVLGWKYERVPQWTGLPNTATAGAAPLKLDADTAPDNPAFGGPATAKPAPPAEVEVDADGFPVNRTGLGNA
jgi:hypothetical protein